MLARYFSPCLDWEDSFSVYVCSLSPLYVDYDAVFFCADLTRPTKEMVNRSLPKLRELRENHRSERLSEIQAQDNDNLPPFLAVIEKKFPDSKLSQDFDRLLVTPAWNDLNFIITSMKAHYNFARPYQYDAQLDPVFRPGHPSFPSGHSTQAHVIAALVKLLITDKTTARAVDKIAKNIALNREIAGVHYAFDSKAGKQVAKCFVARFVEHPIIKGKLTELKKLLSAAKQSQTAPNKKKPSIKK